MEKYASLMYKSDGVWSAHSPFNLNLEIPLREKLGLAKQDGHPNPRVVFSTLNKHVTSQRYPAPFSSGLEMKMFPSPHVNG